MAPISAAPTPASASVASFNSPISEQAYIISQSILLALAIINTISRTAIRWVKFKKLFYDDYFLFVALASLITSTAISFWNYTIDLDLSTLQAAEMSLDSIMYSISGDVLLWAAIYCVKFSFMIYFRGLLRLQPVITKWWWFVLSFIIPCAIGTVFSAFYLCPVATAKKMVQCISAPLFIHDELIVVYVSVFADIATDLLLLSIPLCLLTQLQISPKQKFAIGIVLCCSVFMIAIAILRGVSTYIRGTSDQVWTLFWINTQANVAVIMNCFTAWRTFYLSKHQTDADLRRRNNVQNLNRVQTSAPQRTCWLREKLNKKSEGIHMQQLREAQAENAAGWNSTDPTQNGSGNTNSTGQEHGTQPGHIPRAFLRAEPRDLNHGSQPEHVPRAFLRTDSRDHSMGMPELRRISRLQPGDRVLVFSGHMGAVSTESFV
ncbi:hypothetical protein MMC17_000258 [Xylographa soralifera]|nr:hypothetical protein [Xylographa soralifera]